MITSSKTASDVKLIVVRAFTKMGCSTLVASRAYKAGKKLVLDSSQEEFVIEMLLSLSKLAFKSMLLIPEQVELLLSFINRESACSIPSKALRCLRFLSSGVCHLPINANVLRTLFHVLDNADFSLNSQNEALRVLCKIFSCNPPSLPYMDMPEFMKKMLIVETAAQSPITDKRFLALGLLVEISCNLKMVREGHSYHFHEQRSATNVPSEDSSGGVGFISNGNGLVPFPKHVSLLVMDQITLLVDQLSARPDSGGPIFTPKLKPCRDLKQECICLLNFIMLLVEEYPTLGPLVLDRVRCLLEALVDMYGFNIKAAGGNGEASTMDTDTEIPSSLVCEFTGFEGKECALMAEELVLCLCRFVGACLRTLDKAGAISVEVYQTVKFILECIQQIGSSSRDMCIVFPLRLQFCLTCHCCGNGNNTSGSTDLTLNEPKISAHSSISQDNCWVDHEWMTLEFAKKLMRKTDFWAAYRTGKYAACKGAWFSATFTFRLLIKQVKSDACHYWLKSLALFAGAESEIRLLLYPEQGIQLINGLQVNSERGKPYDNSTGLVDQSVTSNADMHDYGGKFARAYSRVCSAEEMLEAAGRTFYFQRWFLSLRAKFLQIVVDVLGLQSSVTCTEGNIYENVGFDGPTGASLPVLAPHMRSLAYQFMFISFRLKTLAKEFDLLATSFMDIDRESFRSISRLALNCSLLAFCTSFAIYFPNLPAYNNGRTHISENSEQTSRSVLIQDLAERLRHIDSKISMDLWLFLAVTGDRSSYLQSTTQISHSGRGERATLSVCRFAVSNVLHIQEEAKGAKDESDVCLVFRAGLQLLSNIVRKWINIPFQTPKSFFRVRPCTGAELFAFSADAQNSDEISVSPGFCLSLNLCVQMNYTLPKGHVRVTKLYCIIAARLSDRLAKVSEERKGQIQSDFRAMKSDEMVSLNEELLLYMRSDLKKTTRVRGGAGHTDGLVKAFVCCEPNERGQGFSTCLLDVSAFSEGSYQIIWHSCCIDSKGSYWSLLPLNTGPIFSVKKSYVVV
ncbi:uncharacterized protein LOC143860711 isoform X2 [Tasmannia lanceolata]